MFSSKPACFLAEVHFFRQKSIFWSKARDLQAGKGAEGFVNILFTIAVGGSCATSWGAPRTTHGLWHWPNQPSGTLLQIRTSFSVRDQSPETMRALGLGAQGNSQGGSAAHHSFVSPLSLVEEGNPVLMNSISFSSPRPNLPVWESHFSPRQL